MIDLLALIIGLLWIAVVAIISFVGMVIVSLIGAFLFIFCAVWVLICELVDWMKDYGKIKK